MLKKYPLILLGLTLMIALAACNDKTEDSTTNDDDELAVLEATLDVPETADVEEEVEFKAEVTYGDEKVADADEVEFEIWLDDKQDDSEMIAATNNEDGTYTASKRFDHDGDYTVQVHVTARDMHTMPLKKIVIGAGSEHKEAAEEHDDAEHEHEHGHTEGFSMHFMEPESPKADDEIELMTHVQLDNEPLAHADIKYEIMNEEADIHEWANAEETTTGEYTAKHTFTKAGTYEVVIHVKNDDDLHEHETHQIEIVK